MLAIPLSIVERKLVELQQERLVLEKYGELAQLALTSVRVQVEMLEEIVMRGRESANDLLTLDEAIDWSGLSADALRKNYPSIGEYSDRRWRRGALPCRTPFRESGVSGGQLSSDELAAAKTGFDEMIDRAVADALAA